jgi:hypothetical protein
MTRTPTDDELHNIAIGSASTRTPLDARCLTGRALCIDKTSRTLRWVVDGKVRSTLAVRFGASYSPTREGLFHVGWKSADHVSKLYGSAMPFSMFFSGGQAVHYSSDFAGPRLLRRLARLRERARLRRDPVVVQPGGPRGQGRHLLVVSSRSGGGGTCGFPTLVPELHRIARISCSSGTSVGKRHAGWCARPEARTC